MGGHEAIVNGTTEVVELDGVPCGDQLEYLSYKAGQLRAMQGPDMLEREYTLGSDTVTVGFADDGSTRVVQPAAPGRNKQVTYLIEPDVGFGYQVHDASGAVVETWSRPADEFLSQDEAALMGYPLYLIQQCISNNGSEAQTTPVLSAEHG